MTDWKREFRRLERVVVQIPFEPDEEGYADRECPHVDCEFVFKVNAEDWQAIFRDGEVFCPQCGRSAPSDQWWPKEQVEHAKQQAFQEFVRRADLAMRTFARSMNRKAPRSGLITWKLKYRGRSLPGGVLPGRSREAFETKLECTECGARYAVIGAAFFCPCCGYNGIEEQFETSLDSIEHLEKQWDGIRDAVEKALGKDAAAIELRHMLEGRLSDGVTAFETLAKYLYGHLQEGPPARGAVFQRVEDGSALWRQAVGEGYEASLTGAQIDRLNLLFQRRHLLEHTDGIVDELYLERSGDRTYRAGQRIVVNIQDVVELANLVKLLGRGLAKQVATLSDSHSAY